MLLRADSLCLAFGKGWAAAAGGKGG